MQVLNQPIFACTMKAMINEYSRLIFTVSNKTVVESPTSVLSETIIRSFSLPVSCRRHPFSWKSETMASSGMTSTSGTQWHAVARLHGSAGHCWQIVSAPTTCFGATRKTFSAAVKSYLHEFTATLFYGPQCTILARHVARNYEGGALPLPSLSLPSSFPLPSPPLSPPLEVGTP